MPELARFAEQTAREAGELLLARADLPREIAEKSRRADIVTDADRASEALIIARLLAATPRAAILAEESGARSGESDERWIVDPLDGTTNYAHGYPFYCVSIAYERAGVVEVGVVHAPAMGETFLAVRGAGALRNGAAISVSPIERIGDALLCTGFHPADYSANARCFAAASENAQAVRRDGSAALDLAYTAMGRFDGFWEFGLAPWDVAAGALLVTEAGGSVSRVDGGAHRLDGRSILADNGRLHQELRALLGKAGA
ncbi:MAG: inositol monophosphatase [Candidatus Eremiobacteraeota bacterium]|nr:inositol monophosphatase [Candidatus Eremiobacteraeota bacterium]